MYLVVICRYEIINHHLDRCASYNSRGYRAVLVLGCSCGSAYQRTGNRHQHSTLAARRHDSNALNPNRQLNNKRLDKCNSISMRFGEFKPGPAKPIGEGKEKKVFVNPENQERVIAEIKKPKEAEFKMDTPLDYSPRQLKGAFYITKIANLVLPNNVPAIHQVGETIEGQQIIESDRVAHSPEHTAVQEALRSGADIGDADELVQGKLINEIDKVEEKFGNSGLERLLDEPGGTSNYSRDEDGNVKYLKTLVPWEVRKVGARHQITLLFDEKDLTKAIKKLKDSKAGPIRGAKEEAESYLERIKELYNEEVKAYAAFDQENLKDPEEGIKEIEALFSAFEAKHDLSALATITDAAEALASSERAAAKADLLATWHQMQKLQNETKITFGQYDELDRKYKDLSFKAVGIMRGDIVHHQ